MSCPSFSSLFFYVNVASRSQNFVLYVRCSFPVAVVCSGVPVASVCSSVPVSAFVLGCPRLGSIFLMFGVTLQSRQYLLGVSCSITVSVPCFSVLVQTAKNVLTSSFNI